MESYDDLIEYSTHRSYMSVNMFIRWISSFYVALPMSVKLAILYYTHTISPRSSKTGFPTAVNGGMRAFKIVITCVLRSPLLLLTPMPASLEPRISPYPRSSSHLVFIAGAPVAANPLYICWNLVITDDYAL